MSLILEEKKTSKHTKQQQAPAQKQEKQPKEKKQPKNEAAVPTVVKTAPQLPIPLKKRTIVPAKKASSATSDLEDGEVDENEVVLSEADQKLAEALYGDL